MSSVLRIVETDVDHTFEARLVLENGQEVHLNIGDLLHEHGRVFYLTTAKDSRGPSLRLAVETRGPSRGYRGVVQTDDGTFSAVVDGRIVCTVPTAREAAIARALTISRTVKRPRTTPTTSMSVAKDSGVVDTTEAPPSVPPSIDSSRIQYDPNASPYSPTSEPSNGGPQYEYNPNASSYFPTVPSPPVTGSVENTRVDAPFDDGDPDDEVVFTREVTREERDSEGRRNAISLD